jgi:hypothetical protein
MEVRKIKDSTFTIIKKIMAYIFEGLSLVMEIK